MIKAVLLIFEPVATWDRIALARRSIILILAMNLLPLLVVASVGEGYGLIHWGRERGSVSHTQTFSRPEAAIFEAGQFLISLVIVFVGAKMLKSVGETFHGRTTYTQAFTAIAYGLGPLFLLRLLDAIPKVNPWVSWSIGIVLSIAALYHGVPRLMEPDPSHALGLYFMCALLVILLTGMLRYVTWYYLSGQFPALEALISQLAARMHH